MPERPTSSDGTLRLQGIILPVTTPFDAGEGVDVPAYLDNLRSWLQHPITGVVVAGSTGEAPFLEREELLSLVDASRPLLEDRILIAGAAAESTRETIRRCVESAARGADAVMLRAPVYYRDAMSSAALRRHFTAVADASPIPIVLYHIPKYVPVDLAPELVGELARHEQIVAIKDSSGDLKNLGALAEACDGSASLLVGGGHLLYPALELGATGGVLGVGLLAPEMACELYESWQVGRGTRAGELQERIGPLHRRVVGRLGVPGIKFALDLLGLRGGRPRPPLLPLPEKGRREVAAALSAAGLPIAAEQTPG